MGKHKHAEAMMEYAKDAQVTDKPWELWEVEIEADKCGGRRWSGLDRHPAWHPKLKYRRKIKTININGHKVPEPVREPLAYEMNYFIPDITSTKLFGFSWIGSDFDKYCLESGLIHLTKEDAIAHAKALLSFTQQEANNE